MRVFVSYTKRDTDFARRLVMDLQQAGANVWVDFLEIAAGDSIIEKIQKGIKSSTNVIAVLSPHSIRSRWVREELSSAQMRMILGKDRYLIPALIKPCNIPPFLQHRRYADFTKSYRKGLDEVLESLDLLPLGETGLTDLAPPKDLTQLVEQTLSLAVGRFKSRVNAIHIGLLHFESHESALICVGAALDPHSQHFQRFILTGIIGGVLKNGSTRIEDDVWRIPNYQHGDRRTRSLLVAPIQYFDSIIGIIHLSSQHVGEFTERDIAFIESVSGHMGQFLEEFDFAAGFREVNLPSILMAIPYPDESEQEQVPGHD